MLFLQVAESTQNKTPIYYILLSYCEELHCNRKERSEERCGDSLTCDTWRCQVNQRWLHSASEGSPDREEAAVQMWRTDKRKHPLMIDLFVSSGWSPRAVMMLFWMQDETAELERNPLKQKGKHKVCCQQRRPPPGPAVCPLSLMSESSSDSGAFVINRERQRTC